MAGRLIVKCTLYGYKDILTSLMRVNPTSALGYTTHKTMPPL